MVIEHHREVVTGIVGGDRQLQQLSCRVEEDMVGPQICTPSGNKDPVNSLKSA